MVAVLPVWSFIDERAHAAYVDAVAHARLPVLGHEKLPRDLARVGGRPPGLAGSSYELFQPPAYYLATALPWRAADEIGGVPFAVRTLRALNLLGLVVTIALMWRLARRVARERDGALAVFAVGLSFLLWPGVVFRSITISNGALEMPLAAGALLALWIAWHDHSRRALLAAGILCGLGLLCRTTFLPLAALLPVVAWRFRHQAPRVALTAVALPMAFLAPWLALNLHRYGALSASALVRRMQGPFLNPSGRPYDLGRLVREEDIRLLNGPWPGEWWVKLAFDATARTIVRVATGLSIAVPLGLWLWHGPRRAWFLFTPLLLGIVALQALSISGGLAFTHPRYLYAVLPAFGLGAGWVLLRAAGPRRTAIAAAALTGLVVALWVILALTPGLQRG